MLSANSSERPVIGRRLACEEKQPKWLIKGNKIVKKPGLDRKMLLAEMNEDDSSFPSLVCGYFVFRFLFFFSLLFLLLGLGFPFPVPSLARRRRKSRFLQGRKEVCQVLPSLPGPVSERLPRTAQPDSLAQCSQLVTSVLGAGEELPVSSRAIHAYTKVH